MGQHHEVIAITQGHVHESWETHEHVSKAIEPCKDAECKTSCNSVETSKLTSYQSNRLFWEIEKLLWEKILLVNTIIYCSRPKEYLSHYTISTWPPIPIEELMPRVWPVVRII